MTIIVSFWHVKYFQLCTFVMPRITCYAVTHAYYLHSPLFSSFSAGSIFKNMNSNMVPKVESSYANRDRLLGSSENSMACSSKTGTSHKVDGVKKSSSNTTTSWNASYKRFLCPFGGSKSKRSDSNQVSLVKKKETRSPVAHSVPGLKIVKESSENDSRPSDNTSLVASHKVGSPCSTKKETNSGKRFYHFPLYVENLVCGYTFNTLLYFELLFFNLNIVRISRLKK